MSEYQYYEFRAIDRPLTKDEMGKLRACSSRATITSTSFVNEYNWGDLKADPEKWVDKYFDAYLYVANWGTRVLEFRLPVSQLDPELASEYSDDDSACTRVIKDKIIVSFKCEEVDDDVWVEAEELLSSMISIRNELANGDYRALYLGWLSGIQYWEETDDDEVEPPVPPGLADLSESLENLVDFLDIDQHLISVAAQNSPAQRESSFDRDDVHAWVAKLASREKDDLLSGFLLDSDVAQLNALRQKFLKENSEMTEAVSPPRRSVAELLRAAKERREEYGRAKAQRKTKEEALRKEAEAAAREKYLDKLVANESQAWAKIEELISTKVPKNYDEAVQLLVDLRDLYIREARDEFGTAIAKLRHTHQRKPSFLDRLVKAGL
jgi:FtsZ-interacting cell division protein YlmF